MNSRRDRLDALVFQLRFFAATATDQTHTLQFRKATRGFLDTIRSVTPGGPLTPRLGPTPPGWFLLCY